MLGDHGRWAKTLMYEMSAKVPLLVVPREGDGRIEAGTTDDRLAELRDVMPTLLELAEIPTPETVEGLSLVGETRRDYIYGEHWEGDNATRMIRDKRFKLVYYAVGNSFQLFDLDSDPRETRDLSEAADFADVRRRLTELLVDNLYGDDLGWVQNGELVGLPADRPVPAPDRKFGNQRGLRFP
jgi:arylsulfatase A-like enzyme